MTDHELGPLPEPAFRLMWVNGAYKVTKPNIGDTDVYTADQLRAAVAAEREACAKVCESIVDEYTRLNSRRAPGLRFEAEVGAMKCESAIRARGQA